MRPLSFRFKKLPALLLPTIIFVLACAALIGLDLWRTWNARTVKLRETEIATTNLARSLAQHAQDTIKTADTALVGLVERLEVDGVQPPQLERLHRLLIARAAELPALQRLTILDSAGQWLTTSQAVMGAAMNNADREYFQYHLTHTDLGPHIGQPIQSRSTNQWIITVSRRVNKANGDFGGVVLASIYASYFQTYYRSFDIGKEGIISFVLQDGTLLVRQPFIESTIGRNMSHTDLFEKYIVKSRIGVGHARSSLDGKDRLYAFHYLDNYPLIVVAGVSKSEILADWLADALLHLAGAILIALVLLILGSRLLVQINARLKAEERARENEKRLRNITDNLPVLIAYIDQNRLFRFANKTFEKWMGLSEDKILNRPMPEAVGDTLYQQRKTYINRALKGERVDFEIESTLNGNSLFLQTSYIPDINSRGQVSGIYTLSNDVTALKISERLIRTITDNIPAFIAYLDTDGRFQFCNRYYQNLLGVDIANLIGRSMSDMFGDAFLRLIETPLSTVLAGKAVSFELPAGAFWPGHVVQYEFIPDLDQQGKVIGFYSLGSDITAHKEAEQKVEAKEKLLRVMTDHLPAFVSYIDLNGRFVFNNAPFEKWFRKPLSEITGQPLRQVYGEEIYAKYGPYFEEALQGKRTDFEFETNLNSRVRYFSASFVPQLDERGNVIGVCGMHTDITVLKQIGMQLSIQVRFDELTGLPNRGHLQEKLAESLARSKRNGMPVAVMFLDIDKFKKINDSLGHHAGDLVLKEFAQRLADCIRKTDIVARLSGDEFIIILEDAKQFPDVEIVAQKIIQAMEKPFVADGILLRVTTSIGIAIGDGNETGAEDILKKADSALYSAKAAGRNQYQIAED